MLRGRKRDVGQKSTNQSKTNKFLHYHPQPLLNCLLIYERSSLFTVVYENIECGVHLRAAQTLFCRTPDEPQHLASAHVFLPTICEFWSSKNDLVSASAHKTLLCLRCCSVGPLCLQNVQYTGTHLCKEDCMHGFCHGLIH